MENHHRSRNHTLLAIVVMAAALAAPAMAGVEGLESAPDLNREAYLAFQEQDLIRAGELAARAWELAESDGDQVGAGLAAANRAAALAVLGRMDEAVKWQQTAEDRLQGNVAPHVVGRLAVARGITLYLQRDQEAGEREFSRAASILGEEDWRLGFATTAIRLWDTLDILAAYERCDGLLDQARESGDATRVAAILMLFGWVKVPANLIEEAIADFEEASGIYEDLGEESSELVARRNIGIAHLRSGRFIRAENLLTEALEETRRVGASDLEFALLDDLSVGYAQAGDQRRAQEADRQAETVLAGIGEALQSGQMIDTPMLDYYHLLRMRYLSQPVFFLEPFPWIVDQMALDPGASS